MPTEYRPSGIAEVRRTFSIMEDTRTHDSKGRGLEMGYFWVRCYRDGQYSGSVRVQPDVAYAHAKRMLLDGWKIQNAITEYFVLGMQNVEQAFENDAKRQAGE